jgi:hypothetical protein
MLAGASGAGLVPPNSPSISHGQAQKVRRDQGAHNQPAAEIERGRADPALHHARHRPASGAVAAEIEGVAGGGDRLHPQQAIGRIKAPILIARIVQIVQHGRRHDGQGLGLWAQLQPDLHL